MTAADLLRAAVARGAIVRLIPGDQPTVMMARVPRNLVQALGRVSGQELASAAVGLGLGETSPPPTHQGTPWRGSPGRAMLPVPVISFAPK